MSSLDGHATVYWRVSDDVRVPHEANIDGRACIAAAPPSDVIGPLRPSRSSACPSPDSGDLFVLVSVVEGV